MHLQSVFADQMGNNSAKLLNNFEAGIILRADFKSKAGADGENRTPTPKGNQILSLARLPIPPHPLAVFGKRDITYSMPGVNACSLLQTAKIVLILSNC